MKTKGLVAASLATAALTLGAPGIGVAQEPAPARVSAASSERAAQPKRLVRLGTRDALVGPVRSAADLKRMGSASAMQRRVSTVMDRAGLTGLTAGVLRTLSAADTQSLEEVQIAPGTRLEWMAFREGNRPTLLRPVEWAGRQPFDAYQFRVEHDGRAYTFVVPKACGNLALLRADAIAPPPVDDSAQRAREADERARAEREKAEQDRLARERAEAERLEAERRAAEEAERARREAERLEQRLEAERRARERVDWFVAGFFGKERRVRELDAGEVPNAAAFDSLEFGQCSPLLGVKGGLDIRLSDTWRMAPALGVAINTDEGDDSSLFAEVEFNRQLTRGFVGTGLGVWDLNHGDTVAATWLLHGGVEVHRTANDHRLFLVAEGRLFLNELNDIASNYQFWGGLRYVVR